MTSVSSVVEIVVCITRFSLGASNVQDMSSNYLETLFGLTGQTAVVIGGAGVWAARCAGLVQAGATSSSPI